MSNRPSTESPRPMSHGRGGAGNMGSDTGDRLSAEDLVTPTIKSDVYTTGRGGTGNMAKNDPVNPQIARESQDVEEPPRPQSRGDVHFGRGGAANVFHEGDEIKVAAKQDAKEAAKKEAEANEAAKKEANDAKEVKATTPPTVNGNSNGAAAGGEKKKRKTFVKDDFKGLADRGKEFLFGRYKKNGANNGKA